jgi:NAD(P)-dependent dehydrogenase (short-subunit alcohol dehydrogenase family)
MTDTRLLDGRVAIVTGAGRGLGAAVAQTLAGQGAAVVVNDYGVDTNGDSPDAAPANQTAAAIRWSGGRAVAHIGSVAEVADVRALIGLAESEFGRLDILVNCAGIIIRNLVVDTPEEDWDRQVAVHLRGTFLCCKYAALSMAGRRYGRIINFTSESGLCGFVGANAYSASKTGILGLTWTMSKEVAESGITVNAIAPRGATRMGKLPIPESVVRLRKIQNVRYTAVQPDAVAAAVAYFASEEAGYVNGRVIGVEGDRIDLWSEPAVTASVFNEGDWTPEAVRRRFKATLGSRF